MIGIIGGTVAAVAGLGAWLRWTVRPCLATFKIGIVVGRMQQRRRYQDAEEGTLAS